MYSSSLFYPPCFFSSLLTPSSSHLSVFPPHLYIDWPSACSYEVVCNTVHCVAIVAYLASDQSYTQVLSALHYSHAQSHKHACANTSPLSYIWEIKNIHDELELYIKSNIWIIYVYNQPHYWDILVYPHTRPQRDYSKHWYSYMQTNDPLVEDNRKINLILFIVWRGPYTLMLSVQILLIHTSLCVCLSISWLCPRSHPLSHILCLVVSLLTSLMETQLKTLSGWNFWKRLCGTDMHMGAQQHTQTHTDVKER